MYENYYGLSDKPFALSPDPNYLYQGRQHRYAITLLDYALREGVGFALITGEVGCGKTTIVQHFLRRADYPVSIGLIANTHKNMGSLLPWVARAAGVDIAGSSDASEWYERFVDHLTREYAAGRRVVIVIDEAQNLGLAGLEELRVLSNINAGKDLLLQTVLIGQPELRAKLRNPELRQFAQRIAVDYHVEPLSRDETHAYVEYRLTIAGRRTELFAVDAIDLLHDHTGGVPRLINQICETALIYGFADQLAAVDVALMRQALDDRAASGLLPVVAPHARGDGISVRR